MINPARFETQYKAIGGVFHATALIQKRMRELNRGAKPLVEEHPRNLIEMVLAEMDKQRIKLVQDNDANRDLQRGEVERMAPTQNIAPAGIPVSDEEMLLNAFRSKEA